MRKIAKVGALVAMALSAVAAFGFYDQQILIERALNSPNLTVRYSGAKVALVEFKLNGVSLGTRTVSAAKTAGETTFNLDLAMLSDGDNLVEVRLYDKAGKLVGTETSTITQDDGAATQVRITYPKMGQTVMGGLDIKVGFGKELRNAYVSFFVDNQFKAMTNSAPFSFSWDTTREANGWHEIEAMLVDDSSTTFKTKKVKVLVNNPGGQTPRLTNPVQPTTPPSQPPTTAPSKTEPPVAKGNPSTAASTGATKAVSAVSNLLPPTLSAITSPNGINPQTGDRAGVKSGSYGHPSATGTRLVTPTTPGAVKSGSVTAKTTPSKMVIQISPSKTTASGASAVTTVPNTVSTAATGAPARMSLEKGTKMPFSGNFKISLNGSPIRFDVQPRVQDGVAMAPVRHLLEGAGGTVDWDNQLKMVKALADGKPITLSIGDKMAKVGDSMIELEISPFLENGRTIIPISFLHDTFKVNIEVDAKTGMVLITRAK
ncbi:MAG: hypothetical protein HZC36_08375 [Armatimonadetes bacterium]|nr:hypothetical protein [Armatimonadota bacterium]